MKKTIISISIVIVLIILTALIFDWGRKRESLPNENILATTTSEQNNLLTSNAMIVVGNIKDNQEVSSPIEIRGQARGNWFFEASFPIKLVDIDGNILASTIATAESDWMTTEFVSFNAKLEYIKSTSTDHAIIVLSKDNPSGDPKFDKSIYIPVVLK